MKDLPVYNELKNEESIYLKHHSTNPIMWRPYNAASLSIAKEENRPIFLSIGYSACHWCQVMAQESFANEEIAELLNQHFVCIKVDREEYPDIDSYYQQACQLFTRTSGWPLNAFLLPDLRPFFAVTYLPPQGHENNTGFKDLLLELIAVFKDRHQEAEANAQKVTEMIAKGPYPKDKVEFQGHFPHPMSILDAIKKFQDNDNGGYGEAPKFPNFAFNEWMVEQMLEGQIREDYGNHCIKTIEHMLLGGIMDHVRGGIHRYSTDKSWGVPHFEKMLCDQAGLLRLMAKASNLYPSPLLFDQMISTIDYLKNEMLHENKYFMSAQAASSENHEGLYYTFSQTEFEDLINNNDDEEETLQKSLEQLKQWFEISPEGNFHSALNVVRLNPKMKNDFLNPEGWEKIRKVRQAMLNERKERIPPITDNKGIASWNFMLLSALCDVIQYARLDTVKRDALDLLQQGIEGLYNAFITAKDSGGMTLRHSTTGKGTYPLIEDYIFFAEAQLRIYETIGNVVFKDNAYETISYIIREFQKDGKFYTRSLAFNEVVNHQNQEVQNFDQSIRSPLATLINLLRRSAILYNEKELLTHIEKIKDDFTNEILKNPLNAGEALRALTYPEHVYRAVKVPKEWLNDPKFLQFRNYFMPRFVFDYHGQGNNRWQICNLEKCELQGDGVEEFIKVLTPPAKEEPADTKPST